MDVSVAAVVVLLGLVALRWGLILFGATLVLESRRSCPACFAPTLRVRRPVLRVLLPMAAWRWCPTCRWSGPVLKPSTREEVSPWTARRDRSRV